MNSAAPVPNTPAWPMRLKTWMPRDSMPSILTSMSSRSSSAAQSWEGKDFQQGLRHYYYFHPQENHRLNLWKKTGQSVNLVESCGHRVRFGGLKPWPESFIMRHYMIMSKAAALRRYCGVAALEQKCEEPAFMGPATVSSRGNSIFPILLSSWSSRILPSWRPHARAMPGAPIWFSATGA